MNIKLFIDTWNITATTGPLSQPGQPLASRSSLVIGTDTYGASSPSFNEQGEVQVGFALLSSTGEVLLPKDGEPIYLTLVGNQLRWHGSYENQELNINVALAEIFRNDNNGGPSVSYYLFGSTVYGDPDQVGIWGASGTGG
jgi:hypothetical protein